ncbi:hypothetical protein EON80_04735 [bacterium]|nr:MAG: hypothetical protein EON80_04735 [bacterium]
MRFSSRGKFLGVENLAPAAATKAAPANDKPVAPGQAIDSVAFTVAAITQALPTLWPEKDVQNGDTWQAEINWPLPSPTNPKTMVPTQLGKWDMTLKGEENVGGKVLQRVGLVGTINVDSAQFEAPNAKEATKMRGKTKQDVKGDVWFDAAAGHIVRTDLIVGAHVEGGPKDNKDGQSWADFTGSVQLNLKPTV